MTPDEGRKVLIFDNDTKWASAAKEVLLTHGFTSDIASEDFSECRRLAAETVYVAAIVNVQGLRNPRKELSQFTDDFPAIGLVIVEDKADPELEKFVWPPNPIAHACFGSKQDHNVTEISSLVLGLVKLKGMLPGDMQIRWPEKIDEILSGYAESWSGDTSFRGGPLSLKVLKDELEIVISQMFSDPAGQPIARQIAVEALGGDFQQSLSSIFRITPVILLATGQNKSAVLKFGPAEEIKRESRNYDKFVEWFLTVDQTVRKIEFTAASRFAGLLYSYPRDVSGGYVSYAEYIRRESTTKCVAIIEDMFNVDNQHWLGIDGSRFVESDDMRFQTYYINNVLHASLHEMRTHHFRKMEKEALAVERKQRKQKQPNGGIEGEYDTYLDISETHITIPPLNLKIPHPMRFLEQPFVDLLKFTIVHGDLHAHNILIDDSNRYFFIDFFYTGFGDIYRDFIELELSVRYDLLCSRTLPDDKRLTSKDSQQIRFNGLGKLVRLEKALIKKTILNKEPKDPQVIADSTLNKAYEIIRAIRYYARENCPELMRLYYMGLVVSSLKALKYFFPLDVKLHRTILAGMYVDLIEREAIK